MTECEKLTTGALGGITSPSDMVTKLSKELILSVIVEVKSVRCAEKRKTKVRVVKL